MKYLITGIDEKQRKLIAEKTYNAIDIENLDILETYLTEDSLENYIIVYIANDTTSKEKKYIAFEEKLDDIKEFPLCVTSIVTIPLDTDLEKQANALNERYLLHNATLEMLRECSKYGIIKLEEHDNIEEIHVSHVTENGDTKKAHYLLDRFTETLLSPAQEHDFALIVQQLLYAKEYEKTKK